MAITFVGATSGTGTGSGVSLPGSYQDGDIVIAFAYNRNNTTVPGAPTGGTYTFVLNNSSAYTNRAVLYYRVISGDTTFPGFASATSHYALAIYRGQNKGDPIGASSSTTNNTATMSYADFTEEYTDNTSWIVGCGGHRNNDSGSITHDSTWSNTTFYNHVGAADNGKVGIGSISDISSWGGDSVATLGAANGHSTITIELKAEKTLVADSASFTLTGQDAALIYDMGATEYTLVADSGVFVLTGDAVSMLFNRLVTAANGSFTLAGQTNNLLFNRLIASDSGSLGFTGGSANLLFNRVVQAASGTFTLTGGTANFGRTYILAADSGNYVLSGQDTNLNWSGDTTPDGGYDWLIKRRRRRSGSI